MSSSSTTSDRTGSSAVRLQMGSTQELPPIQSAYTLDGKNYLKWSQLVRMYLKGRGKLSHLLGTGPKPEDPTFEAWDNEDSLIMSWLVSSMNPEIGATCMFMSSVKEIWDAIQQTYSKVHDGAQIYDLKTKVHRARQGNKSVTEYSNFLKGLWQELDHYQCVPIENSKDAMTFKKFLDRERVYDFLAGLNMEFDAVRVQILGREETPSLNEAISIVLAEEGRRSVMIETQPLDSSVLVAKKNSPGNPADHFRQNKDSLWCTYCKKPRYTKDKC